MNKTPAAGNPATDAATAADGMNPARVPKQSLWRRLGRDFDYVLGGFPLALGGFVVLLPLTVASLGTLVVWIGVLLLPVTLMIATAFANISRKRMRRYGIDLPPVESHPADRGVRGAITIMSNPRQWLDLTFAALIAFPLRLVTFILALTWTLGALTGVTYALWAWAVPGDSGWTQLLRLIAPSSAPASARGQYLLEVGINCALGLIFLLTLPVVLRGLARLDIIVAAPLLGSGEETRPPAVAQPPQSPTAGTSQRQVSSRKMPINTRAWAWLAASVPAMILVAVGWPVIAAFYDAHPALAMVLTLGHCLAAVLAVRWGWAGIALAVASVLGTMVLTSGAGGPWPWPVPTMLTHYLLIVVLSLCRPWYYVGVAWAAGALLTIAGPALTIGLVPGVVSNNGVVVVSVSAGLALLGIFVRLWTLSQNRVERAETVSAAEAQRRQEIQERNRIARELHDVVAHSMSVINVQATTAQYRKPGIGPEVQTEFDDIANSSRQALGEMRALLGLLRSDDAAPTAPAPGLGDIDDLIEATRAAGTEISYSGQVPSVPAPTGLTAFRVVQEGLSNALRHAPGAAVQVRVNLDERGSSLLIDVLNDAITGEADPTPGAGHGLEGIRERVAALGGTVEVGPRPQGGFAVCVSLPAGVAPQTVSP